MVRLSPGHPHSAARASHRVKPRGTPRRTARLGRAWLQLALARAGAVSWRAAAAGRAERATRVAGSWALRAPRRGLAPASAIRRARESTIASVLATVCQNTELTPTPADIELVRAAVLCLINRQRADDLEMPLAVSGDLQRAAEAHSAEMVAQDYFQHVSPTGSTPVARVTSAGYIPSPFVGYVIGENIAWGTLTLATPEAIVAAWMASPAHRANILEAEYRETGIGVAAQAPAADAQGAPGATYTQEFGVIIG